jgi:hypothetical protein
MNRKGSKTKGGRERTKRVLNDSIHGKPFLTSVRSRLARGKVLIAQRREWTRTSWGPDEIRARVRLEDVAGSWRSEYVTCSMLLDSEAILG